MIRILAITGVVGGAKLALGLSKILDEKEVLFLVNTGDDFQHLGLEISPDIDSLLYALSGKNNPELGWGRKDESWNFISTRFISANAVRPKSMAWERHRASILASARRM